MLRRGLTPVGGLLALTTLLSEPFPAPRVDRAPTSAAKIYDFALFPTSRAPGARGEGLLTLGWSPFGVAVNIDGYLIYDLELSTSGLIHPARLVAGGDYVAWISSPDLERIERLGRLVDGMLITRITTWNKFLVLVTLESDPDTQLRAGPVVLQGRSPSGLIASFQSHELFNLIPH